MATSSDQLMEFQMNHRLSKAASAPLVRRAAESGRDLAAVASALIEEAVASPTVDQVLAPFRRQVSESGMGDAELDDFHRELLAKVWSERRANF